MANNHWTEVTLERSGGQIPTLRPKFSIAYGDLTPEEKEEADELIAAAEFFKLPDSYSKTGFPDTFEYRLTVKSSDESHTVIFHDQDGHPGTLDTLVQWIITHKPEK